MQFNSPQAIAQGATPISRLPVELLVEIFHWLVHGCKRPPREWRQVLYVCSRWRELALATPTLWTTVYMDGSPPLLLEYSLQKAAPLPVQIDLVGCHGFAYASKVSEILRRNADRLSRLNISYWMFYKCLCHHFEHLENLKLAELGMLDSDWELDVDAVDPDPHSETELFGLVLPSPAQLPSLRRLTLNMGAIAVLPMVQANPECYDSLRYLNLCFSDDFSDTITNLFRLLPRCPSLEELRLAYPPRRASSLLSKHEKVSLTSLRKLVLKTDAKQVTPYLEHLVVPDDAHVVLVISNRWQPAGAPVFSAIPLDMPLALFREELAVDVVLDDRKVRVQAAVAPVTCGGATLGIRVDGAGEASPRKRSAIVARLARAFKGAAVTLLSVQTTRELCLEQWASLLRGFPAAVSLAISVKTRSKPVFQALTPRSGVAADRTDGDRGATHPSSTVLCPRLRQLRVNETGEVQQITGGTAKAMFAMVRSRAARGMILELLEVAPLQRRFRLVEGDIEWVADSKQRGS